MSKESRVFYVEAPADDVLQACSRASESLGWKAKRLGSDSGEWTEGLSLLANSPVKARVSVRTAGGHALLEISISNLGFGPLQSRYVRGRLEKFKEAIESSANAALTDYASRPPEPAEVEIAAKKLIEGAKEGSRGPTAALEVAEQPAVARTMTSEEASMTTWDHQWMSLQWKAGFAGLGKGWNQEMVAQIEQMGRDGYELVSVVQQKDPTWFILFFKRPIAE